MLAAYLGVMHLEDAGTVLDMGCDTGVASRARVRRPEFTAKVGGVDFSPYLITAAARLAAEQRLDDRIDFAVADTRPWTFLPLSSTQSSRTRS